MKMFADEDVETLAARHRSVSRAEVQKRRLVEKNAHAPTSSGARSRSAVVRECTSGLQDGSVDGDAWKKRLSAKASVTTPFQALKTVAFSLIFWSMRKLWAGISGCLLRDGTD